MDDFETHVFKIEEEIWERIPKTDKLVISAWPNKTRQVHANQKTNYKEF
jgi:hypothetical protein